MLRNYFKFAWRNIRLHSAYFAINVVGLSCGICGSLIIYLIVHYELSYDRFHPDKDRIYRIVATQHDPQGKENHIGGTIDALPMAMRDQLTGFQSVATFHNYTARVTIPDGSREAKQFDATEAGVEVSPIIIAEPHKYFGSLPLEDVMGREVYYNDSLHLVVSGIVKDWEKNTDFSFKDFISFATIDHSILRKEIDLKNWGNWNPTTQGFVKLSKGVSPRQIESQLPAFLKEHLPDMPGYITALHFQPLTDIHFDESYKDVYS